MRPFGTKKLGRLAHEAAQLIGDYASSALCSIASGILATDMSVRAIWLSKHVSVLLLRQRLGK